MCGLLGFPSGELGPAVISLIGAKSGDYYENTYPRSGSLLADVHRSYSVALLRPARPSYTVTLQQVGANVVATGSGAINLTGLSFLASGTQGGAILQPPIGAIVTGSTDSANVTFFSGFSGPTSFGSGNGDIASSGSGDRVGIVAFSGSFRCQMAMCLVLLY